MEYRRSEREIKISVIVFVVMVIAKIAAVAGIIWLSIFAYNEISASLEFNKTTIIKEFGRAWGEVKSEFNEGVEVTE